MRGRVSFFLFLTLLASLVPAAPSVAATKDASVPEHVAGRALVGAKAGGKAQARQAIEGNGGKIVSYYAPGNFFIVKTPTQAPSWVTSMQNSRSVRYAELDHIVQADLLSNDPYLNDGKLWGLNDPEDNDIDAPEAWEVQTSAANVVVGVIDTGVDYTHGDLDDNMWINVAEQTGIAGQDDDGNGWIDDVYGADCRNNDGNPMDDHYHGTHVAGTIGAEGNNNTGVVGVAWDVQIMALKFLSSSGSGATSDAIECLDYAAAQGADLTSNSWGGGGYSQALRDAIARTQDANMLFVAAAGNDGKDSDRSPNYPSGYDNDNIVSVASTTSTDGISSFSNFGASTVDLGAPGSYIWSTMPGNAYDDLSGTSMATPHVAGAAALILGKYGADLNYDVVLDRLYGSVDALSSLTGKTATGGRLNIATAIETETTPPGAIELSAGASTRTSVALSWSIAPSDGDPIRYDLSYSTDNSTWTSAAPPSATATTATVGGLRPGKAYTFRLVAKDNVGNASADTTDAATSAGAVVFDDDGEGGLKWSAEAPWKLSSQRPHSGTTGWTDSENGNHANSKDVSIRSNSFSLVDAIEPRLTFWHRYNLEPNYDYGYVYISTDGGSSWTELARYNGHQDHYRSETVDLSSYAGKSDVKLRFRLYSDRSITYDGWYVDDVIVSAASTVLDVSNVSASPSPFSPNGDGRNETTTVSFEVNKAASWTATIKDSSNVVLCTQTGIAANGGTQSFVWGGGNDAADCDAADATTSGDGTYSVTVDASASSETDSAATTVAIDKTAPTVMSPSATASSNSATITWTTDEASDSKVEYALKPSSGCSYSSLSTAYDPALATTHSVTLSSLSSSTTYCFWVTSRDAVGNENAPSGPHEFTTEAASESSTMHVHDLDGRGTSLKGGRWKATVRIYVYDNNDAPVEGAIVTGGWSVSVASATAQCTTNSSGWCEVVSDEVHKGSVKSLTFTVSDLSHSSLTHASPYHSDPDGDSDLRSITVNKPN